MPFLPPTYAQVPNISVKEIALEVEAQFSATFEYSPLLGWQAPAGLVFEVLELERRVEGANLPLPKALIKSLLNMIMPSVGGSWAGERGIPVCTPCTQNVHVCCCALHRYCPAYIMMPCMSAGCCTSSSGL